MEKECGILSHTMSGDSSHPGRLEDSLELSLQGVLEECGSLGKSEERSGGWSHHLLLLW